MSTTSTGPDRPHLVVVGSGIAGLTAALEASRTHRVTLLAKAVLTDSSTRWAQGGIAAVSTPEDSVADHVRDTLDAGAGLSEQAAVEVLCAGGPAALATLLERGVDFDRDRPGHGADGLSHGLEAAHSHARILHAGGDATGARIVHALLQRLAATDVEVRADTTVTDLLVQDGRVVGVRLLGTDDPGGAEPPAAGSGTTPDRELRADAVLLATGGAGQLYPFTTNPVVATGDGVAMALRAGAVVADLEMYQFHPTALDLPGSFLVSEAVRGEGAVLRDATGRRFMPDLHPAAELAPRDVVARAIAAAMAEHGRPVVLDATALGSAFLARRFPTIDAACRQQSLDWARVPVPVTPAAHYAMGGVRTDTWGRTSLPGLLAVGEVACTGLHGANRLASNSLLEGAVYAARAVAGLRSDPPAGMPGPRWAAPAVVTAAELGHGRAPATSVVPTRAELQQLMWSACGLSRDAGGLAAAAGRLAGWSGAEVTDAKSAEDANLLLLARAMVHAAVARTESRGGHHRTDHPRTDPTQAVHRSLRLEAGPDALRAAGAAGGPGRPGDHDPEERA